MTVRYAGEHVAVEDVETAIDLLAGDPEARVLASGYSLLPLLKDGNETAGRLVDVSGIDALRGIEREVEATRIGALTSHDRIAASSAVTAHVRALADATDSVGDYQAKHCGTIGGNLVFADPKYDAPAAFLALDGRVALRGPDGDREVGADEWFRGPGETAIGSTELVTAIIVPDAAHSGYVRASAYSGYAIVGTAAALDVADGVVESARVAVNGAKSYPIRLPAVESALVGARPSDEVVERAANAALSDVDPDGLRADDAAAGRYRLRLVRSYCRRAIERALADE